MDDPILLFDRAPGWRAQLAAAQHAECRATLERGGYYELDAETRERAHARAEARLRAQRAAELHALEAPIRARLRHDRDGALADHLSLVTSVHDIVVIANPRTTATNSADPRARRIFLRMADDGGGTEAAALFAYHEIGHVIAGPCRGADHYADPTNRAQHACLACERSAWKIGQRLALEWTEAMHRRMAEAIGTYRRSTPAPTNLLAELKQLASPLGFRFEQQRRLKKTLAAEMAYRP